MRKKEGFRAGGYALCGAVTIAVFILCLCVGSVSVPVGETVSAIWNFLSGRPLPEGTAGSIIVFVRLPRVACTALAGAALAICGASMQGLLRNPLADGSTLGVSSGASFGAALAIALGIDPPGFPGSGTMLMAMLFAFISLALILSLAYRLDFSLATNTIILLGVISSMLFTSMISLVLSFSGDKSRTIIFWTMGSLAGSSYTNVRTMLAALAVCAAVIFYHARELNAFAVGEDNARHVGVDVKRVKLVILVAASALIGICVSIGGTIAFVGLVIPHITRMLTGPNHKRLLPATLFFGAVFLMLADLVGRILLSPLELPIGVVTSIIGSVLFIHIFYSTRKVR